MANHFQWFLAFYQDKIWMLNMDFLINNEVKFVAKAMAEVLAFVVDKANPIIVNPLTRILPMINAS
jgi:hypothetical protein